MSPGKKKIPFALQWTPETEYTTLFGKPILSFTKKELAAYVVFLIKKYDEICERKNKQIGKILFLRKHR